MGVKRIRQNSDHMNSPSIGTFNALVVNAIAHYKSGLTSQQLGNHHDTDYTDYHYSSNQDHYHYHHNTESPRLNKSKSVRRRKGLHQHQKQRRGKICLTKELESITYKRFNTVTRKRNLNTLEQFLVKHDTYGPACKKTRKNDRTNKKKLVLENLRLGILLSPFVHKLKQIMKPFSKNKARLCSKWKRLDRVISTSLINLRGAIAHSELSKTPCAQQQRIESHKQLGDFGMALFSPLDLVLDRSRDCHHAEVSSPIQKKSMIDLKNCFLRQSWIDNWTRVRHLLHLEKEDESSLDMHDSTSSICSSEPEYDEVKVDPEDPSILQASPHILSHDLMKEISQKALPFKFQSSAWKRIFSISRDGDSFVTFLSNVRGYDNTLLVIKTEQNVILGGFATNTWERQKGLDGRHFFGEGHSFLFNHIPSSEKTNDPSSTDHLQNGRVNIYNWTGANNYNQLLNENAGIIAMGGGGLSGAFGIHVEDFFSKGTSGSCETYANPPLAQVSSNLSLCGKCQGESYFQIVDMEVYGFIFSWY